MSWFFYSFFLFVGVGCTRFSGFNLQTVFSGRVMVAESVRKENVLHFLNLLPIYAVLYLYKKI